MARQEQTCWRCSTQWVSEDGPRTSLRVIPRGMPAAVAGNDGVLIQARMDTDRWVDEGGSVPFEAAALFGATTDRR